MKSINRNPRFPNHIERTKKKRSSHTQSKIHDPKLSILRKSSITQTT